MEDLSLLLEEEFEKEFGNDDPDSEDDYGNEKESQSDGEAIFQTFNIKCKKKLSSHAKSVLLAWSNKPFYCANEDILYLFKSNLIEQEFLLRTLHSMAIFLQNATCTNFFDISICSVSISSAKNWNKSNHSEFVESITFKLKSHVTLPPEKAEIPW